MKAHSHSVEENNIHTAEEMKIQPINCINWIEDINISDFSVAQIMFNMTPGSS